MYSEELEALISAALADECITEKERNVLIKRAEAEGIDREEFELVLDSRVILANKRKASENKSSKLGDYRKCPSCGLPMGTFLASCPSCGYEFTGVEPNAFVKKFADGLHKAVVEASQSVRLSGYMKFFDTTGQEEAKQKEMAMCNAENLYVKTYPLPLAKEDVIELLTFMSPKIKSNGANETTHTWRRKYEAVLSKLETMATRDQSLQPLVAHYRSQLKTGFFGKFYIGWKSLSRTARIFVWLGLFYVVFFGLLGILFAALS